MPPACPLTEPWHPSSPFSERLRTLDQNRERSVGVMAEEGVERGEGSSFMKMEGEIPIHTRVGDL